MKTFKRVWLYVTAIVLIQAIFLLTFCAIARSFDISTFHPIAWGIQFVGNVGFIPLAIDIIEDNLI